MYTKVFRTIYDGTLADNWQALVTFQQLLILSNEEGVVDMTIAAIHRTTGIPVDILQQGIAILEAPDHGSRTPDMEGRRIARLDEHREWGWFLINFAKYRQMLTREEKKEADRVRIQAKREAEKTKENSNVADCRGSSRTVADCRKESQVSPIVANVAHTDTERATEAEKSKSKDQSSLRSDSSSGDDRQQPESGKPALQLTQPPTAPADLTERKAERLRQVTEDAIAAFNAKLGKPNGLLSAVHATVGREKRQGQVKRCLRTARQICEQQFGSTTITPAFWEAYFAECDRDPFKSGRQQPGRGHENWTPSFEYLTREDVMLAVFDKATSEAAA
jgi:hypothetical protein